MDITLIRSIRAGRAERVYFFAHNTSTEHTKSFDKCLQKLADEIREIYPKAYFGANMSSEKYWLDLRRIPKDVLAQIVEVLKLVHINKLPMTVAPRYC